MAELRRYGTATSIMVPVIKLNDTDFADVADYAYAAGDIVISKDAGTPANLGGTPTEVDFATSSVMMLDIPLTATEMQCAQLDIVIVDAALEHQAIKIETYGHPSAEHPEIGIPTPDRGVITAATSTTADLATSAPTTDDIINGSLIYISEGTGAGQTRQITDYDQVNDRVTVDPVWGVNPSTDSVYWILPSPPAPISAANATPVDVVAISGDSTAADNMEADYDGTGFNKANSQIGTAGTVTATLNVNASQISGDTATADKLQSSVAGIITGSAQTGTLSTTQATTDLTGYTDDQLIGRTIVWTSGNADGEATDITDYANASGLITFTALTTAPANGDTFVIF